MAESKKVLYVISAVLLLSFSLGFAFEFGGGGPMVLYFPGGSLLSLKNINVPILDFSEFQSGVFAIGGYGYGGLPGKMSSGGYGFAGENEITKDGAKYKLEISGGYGAGYSNISFGPIGLIAGLGFGSFDIALSRKVNEDNTSLTDLKNGTLEGYLGANISYLSISGSLALALKISNFAELQAGAMVFAGYSIDGWQVNGKQLTGIIQNDYKFLLNYALYGGIGFGF
ncbi:hypothetical protein [Fervidobacterium sp. 2310opik-2]|uniref:hypothetical protein n=1 Tax=Fervidobacterium sp. 2310opik-2 TaxID=1755815 RepID=UPI0013DEF5B1|nr:hypothetical protein [Fervidobacterium sp. 2310opik-2]KAF2960946.1 hypothetical protein AS161_03765 [Fervidobacterium sp. 2310opik-2]